MSLTLRKTNQKSQIPSVTQAHSVGYTHDAKPLYSKWTQIYQAFLKIVYTEE